MHSFDDFPPVYYNQVKTSPRGGKQHAPLSSLHINSRLSTYAPTVIRKCGTHLYLGVAEGSPAPVHRDGYSVDVRELAQEALVHVHRQALQYSHIYHIE